MHTCSCTIIGNYVGKGEIFLATKSVKEITLVSAILFSLLTMAVYTYFAKIIGLFTNLDELKDIGMSMRPWIIANVPITCFASMIRGIIKALGIQNRILMAHVIVQGIFGLILTYFFGFYMDLGLNGIWLAKTCMIYSLVGYYIIVLRRADWT